jgi:hypothetical protein
MMKFKDKDHRSLSVDAFKFRVEVLGNSVLKRKPVMFLEEKFGEQIILPGTLFDA